LTCVTAIQEKPLCGSILSFYSLDRSIIWKADAHVATNPVSSRGIHMRFSRAVVAAAVVVGAGAGFAASSQTGQRPTTSMVVYKSPT
jgi:hypothetical protein